MGVPGSISCGDDAIEVVRPKCERTCARNLQLAKAFRKKGG